MNPEDAVVDEIDRLVEESLTKPWHQVSGYDNNIGQPRCRCGADWHGLPTAFCPGSDTEGPLPPTGVVNHDSAPKAAMRRIVEDITPFARPVTPHPQSFPVFVEGVLSRMFSTLHTYDTSGESDE